ncbi:MAG: cytochrome c-type biogenesis protein CcmH [Cellvibrionaceae bacterium]|jgi:cytochrome c-type biogenesis protein CcmH
MISSYEAATAFYIGAAALILLGLIFALWPLIKSVLYIGGTCSETIIERKAINVALYGDHLKELEQALALGSIDQPQFDLLKQELERNLIEDSQQQKGGTDTNTSPAEAAVSSTVALAKRPMIYAALVVVLLPLMAMGVYRELGHSDGWQLQAKLTQQVALEEQLASAPSSAAIGEQLDQLNRELVADIEKYLLDKPDDLETTVLLARNLVSIGDYDKAIEVYQQILEKEPQAAQMMAELAQAVFVKADNRAVPVVSMLAGRAISIQPNNLIALGLMGISEFQNANYEKAIGYWQKAVAIYPAGSANGRALQSGIIQAQVKLAAQPQAQDQSVSGLSEVTEEGEAGQVQNQQDKNRAPVIKLAVSLGEAVPIKSDSTVFVYARAWQGAKVPLAIARIKASQLPLMIELNDSMNMAPGMNLSSADKVEVIARLSPSGNAITQPDDWQVSIGPINPKNVASSVYPLLIAKPVALK